MQMNVRNPADRRASLSSVVCIGGEKRAVENFGKFVKTLVNNEVGFHGGWKAIVSAVIGPYSVQSQVII